MVEVQFTTTIVDDERISVAQRDSLVALDVTAEPETLQKWVRSLTDFVLRHPQFALAHHSVGQRKSTLWLVLLQLPNGLQRVHIEHLICGSCRVRLTIANPTIPDLYIGLPNPKDALDRAWAQPPCPCPRCGKGLARHAIWVTE